MTPRLRRSALLSLPGTVVPGLAGYVAFLAIKDIEGASTLGYVSLAWVVANLGAAATGLGPSHTALRLMAQSPGEADAIRVRFRGLVLRRSAVLGLVVAGGGAITLAVSHEMGVMLVVSAPWLVGQALVLFEAETLRAVNEFGKASAVLAGRAVLGWAASIAGAAAIGGLPATILPTAVVGLVMAGLLSGGRYGTVTPEDRTAADEIGRPIGQLSVASYALGYGDRFIVQALLGPVAVATYTLGYQLGEGAMELVTQPVTAASLPKVVHTWHDGVDGRSQALALSRRIGLAILGLTIAAPLVVFALVPTGIFDLISKDPDLPTIVAIVGAAVGLQSLTRVGYGLLLAQGRTRTALNNFIIVGAVSVVLIPLLTWQFDLIGTAVATLVAYGGLALITILAVRAHLEIEPDEAELPEVPEVPLL